MESRRRYQRRTKRPLEASPYLDPVAQALASAPALPLTQGSLEMDALQDRPSKKPKRRSPSPRIRAASAHDQAVLAAFCEADIFSVLDMDVDPDSLHIAASVLQSIDPLLSPISVADAVQAVYVAQEAEFHAWGSGVLTWRPKRSCPRPVRTIFGLGLGYCSLGIGRTPAAPQARTLG